MAQEFPFSVKISLMLSYGLMILALCKFFKCTDIDLKSLYSFYCRCYELRAQIESTTMLSLFFFHNTIPIVINNRKSLIKLWNKMTEKWIIYPLIIFGICPPSFFKYLFVSLSLHLNPFQVTMEFENNS